MTALVVTLVVYKVVLLGIGAWAARRNRDGEDFYLAGRGLGPWVAAISAAASSSSAWTLLGVSGAAYGWGLGAIWLLPTCLGGFALNWFLVARRLRNASAGGGAVTLTEFLATPVDDADQVGARWRRPLTIAASLVILISLGIYVSSQFQAAGKTFAETLDMEFTTSVVVGGLIVLIYTMTGGFWAVSVTDMLQGVVMALACILVPGAALLEVGGFGAMFDGLRAAGPEFADPFRGLAGMAAFGFVVGLFGIALGYPGQPHVVNRFMALRSEDDVRRGTAISLGWAAIVYSGMLIAGWCGRALVETLADGEAVLLILTTDLFPAVVAGVILAAVLSAVMSTADSQLLVCGSTVAHDLADRASTRKVLLDRLTVAGVTAVAIVAALTVPGTIFSTVLFAWSALGAAFGPLLLVRLWRGPVSPGWALAAIVSGFVVAVVWYLTPQLKAILSQPIPAYVVAGIVAWQGARRRAGVLPA